VGRFSRSFVTLQRGLRQDVEGGARGWFLACSVVVAAWPPAAASAQTVPRTALETVADPADRTGTNPANFRHVVDLSNRFDSVDDELFVDHVSWRYAHAFARRRMRARVELPLMFGNVTGRTEAGLGDVAVGWEWLPAVRSRVAVLAGVELTFDSSTNEALAIGHDTAAPIVGLVVAPRDDTTISLRYDQRFSLNAVEGRPDVNKGTLEAAVVRRFVEGMWVRAVTSLDLDVEQEQTWGTIQGEWGRLLSDGFSTWVRGGAGLGASKPADWTVEFGFRVVPER
jgi:hypothetical protein